MIGVWSKIKLGNACQITKGVQFNKLDLENSGDYPCINGGISPSGYSDKWNTESDTITISEGGNSCGYVNFLKTKFWSGGHCYSLLEVKEIIANDFLYYALKGRESLIMNLRVGSGLPNIQQKEIKEFEFVYPKDKPEQTLIAQILSTADAAISQTEKLIAKYQRIKTGLMQDLLTKGIDAKGNIRSKATHKFVVKNGIEVPEEWEVKTLEELFIIKSGTTPLREKYEQYFYQGENCWVKTLDLNDSYIFSTEENITNKAVIESNCKIRPVNSILIAMYGGWNQIGRTGILKTPASTNQAISVLIEPTKEVDFDYILFCLQYFKNRWKKFASSTRKDPNITKDDVGNFLIALPQSLEEQNKISKQIIQVTELINIHQTELSKLHSLKTGLMQDLLSGKVRVKIKEEVIA